jgi:hypothetical protein
MEEKIGRFRKAEAALAELGFEVINPLDVENDTCLGDCNPLRHVGQDGVPTHSWECFMRHDLRELLTCDTVAILPGWAESSGARLELKVSTALKMREILLDEEGLPIAPVPVD